MADPIAVLVIPAEGDPGGLLAPGRCGIIPALAELRTTPRQERWELASNRWPGETYALPLWWDGRLLEEGWDRAWRVAAGHAAKTCLAKPFTPEVTPDDETFLMVMRVSRDAGQDEVLALARWLMGVGLVAHIVRILPGIAGPVVETTP